MSTFANINPCVVNPAAAPLTNAITATTDQFAAQAGAKYLLRFNNASATPANVVFDDPTAVSPDGATAFNPDVTVNIPAGQVRTFRIDANRFRNSSGNIVWTYSASMVNAASLCEIYGPE